MPTTLANQLRAPAVPTNYLWCQPPTAAGITQYVGARHRAVPRSHYDHHLLLRGIELRYMLTTHLALHGTMTIPNLIEDLEYLGFGFAGRASKAVSDALRWKVRRGRVRGLRRGLYGPGAMPRSTEHHIQKRVEALRATASKTRDDDAFWDALGA